jgi:hypothetical protein
VCIHRNNYLGIWQTKDILKSVPYDIYHIKYLQRILLKICARILRGGMPDTTNSPKMQARPQPLARNLAHQMLLSLSSITTAVVAAAAGSFTRTVGPGGGYFFCTMTVGLAL